MVGCDLSNKELIQAGQLIQEAVVMGANIQDLGIVTNTDDVNSSIFRRSQNLWDRALALKDIEVTYSGRGFGPIADPEGEVFTAFQDIKAGKGILNAIYITNTLDIEYMKPQDIVIADDDFSSPVDLMKPNEKVFYDFKQRLLEAPPGLRLFVEFVVRDEVEVDQPVKGHAVRVPRYTVYNMMEAASIEIIDIQKHQKNKVVRPHEIPDMLKVFTGHYRHGIRNKKFRIETVERQREITERFLQDTNDILRLDRFMLTTWAEHIYVPDSNSPDGFEYCIAPKGFRGNAVRLDCTETILLSEGAPIRKRRGISNSLASTCVVVEIDNETREMFGIESHVIWIPVLNQHDKMHFSEPEIF